MGRWCTFSILPLVCISQIIVIISAEMETENSKSVPLELGDKLGSFQLPQSQQRQPSLVNISPKDGQASDLYIPVPLTAPENPDKVTEEFNVDDSSRQKRAAHGAHHHSNHHHHHHIPNNHHHHHIPNNHHHHHVPINIPSIPNNHHHHVINNNHHVNHHQHRWNPHHHDHSTYRNYDYGNPLVDLKNHFVRKFDALKTLPRRMAYPRHHNRRSFGRDFRRFGSCQYGPCYSVKHALDSFFG